MSIRRYSGERDVVFGTTVAGIVGSFLTLALIVLSGILLGMRKTVGVAVK